MNIDQILWDALNTEYHERRALLFAQLKQLDDWYAKKFVELDIDVDRATKNSL